MPDAQGNFKGVGWSQQRSDAWERIFGRPAPEVRCPHGVRGVGSCEACYAPTFGNEHP